MRLSIRPVGLLCATMARTSTAIAARSSSGMVAATDLFSSWAREGLDEKMQSGHSLAVKEILAKSEQYFPDQYKFLDIGCGSGWVVRDVCQRAQCSAAAGVDGAKDMIIKANSLRTDQSCTFHHSDLLSFHPDTKFDVAFSMEVLYYLSDTQVTSLLSSLSSNIIEDNGILVFGIDHYLGKNKTVCSLLHYSLICRK
jgi:trans-aconitate methyltransferase